MVRTTVMLPGKLKARAVRRARRAGMSLGEFIRTSVEQALAQPPQVAGRTVFDDMPTFDGPPPHDVSERIDEFLYGNAEP